MSSNFPGKEKKIKEKKKERRKRIVLNFNCDSEVIRTLRGSATDPANFSDLSFFLLVAFDAKKEKYRKLGVGIYFYFSARASFFFMASSLLMIGWSS